MWVEADVFSGVPNPYWRLTESEMRELVEMLQALPQQKPQPIETVGLGYRGLYVSKTDDMDSSFDKLHIYRGTIELIRSDTIVQLSDKDRRVEYWLLDTGKQHLRGDLFNKISSLME